MSIAPDLDKLMWSIADSGETAAADSFQKRFPELKHELSKRMNLVKDIKKAKALHAAPLVRPEFNIKKPAEATKFKPSGRLVAATAFVLGAAVIFAAAYSIFRSKNIDSGQTSQPVPLGQMAMKCPTPMLNAGTPVRPSYHRNLPDETGSNPSPDQSQPQSQSSANVQDHAGVQETQTANGPVPIKEGAQSSSKSQRIIMKQVPLSTVLHTISSQYGLKIDTAPGFPDPTIDVDSQDKDALAMLKDIGAKYGFGVVEEGEKSVLLVPQAPK